MESSRVIAKVVYLPPTHPRQVSEAKEVQTHPRFLLRDAKGAEVDEVHEWSRDFFLWLSGGGEWKGGVEKEACVIERMPEFSIVEDDVENGCNLEYLRQASGRGSRHRPYQIASWRVAQSSTAGRIAISVITKEHKKGEAPHLLLTSAAQFNDLLRCWRAGVNWIEHQSELQFNSPSRGALFYQVDDEAAVEGFKGNPFVNAMKGNRWTKGPDPVRLDVQKGLPIEVGTVTWIVNRDDRKQVYLQLHTPEGQAIFGASDDGLASRVGVPIEEFVERMVVLSDGNSFDWVVRDPRVLQEGQALQSVNNYRLRFCHEQVDLTALRQQLSQLHSLDGVSPRVQQVLELPLGTFASEAHKCVLPCTELTIESTGEEEDHYHFSFCAKEVPNYAGGFCSPTFQYESSSDDFLRFLLDRRGISMARDLGGFKWLPKGVRCRLFMGLGEKHFEFKHRGFSEEEVAAFSGYLSAVTGDNLTICSLDDESAAIPVVTEQRYRVDGLLLSNYPADLVKGEDSGVDVRPRSSSDPIERLALSPEAPIAADDPLLPDYPADLVEDEDGGVGVGPRSSSDPTMTPISSSSHHEGGGSPHVHEPNHVERPTGVDPAVVAILLTMGVVGLGGLAAWQVRIDQKLLPREWVSGHGVFPQRVLG